MLWKTVLIIPVYIQLFILSERLRFLNKENSKKKWDIVEYQKERVEDIFHARINENIIYRFYCNNAPKQNVCSAIKP